MERADFIYFSFTLSNERKNKGEPIWRHRPPFRPYLRPFGPILGRQMGVPLYFFRPFDRVDD